VAGGRERMNIKHVVLNITPQGTLRLTRILLDEDKDGSPGILKRMPETPIGTSNPGSLSAGL
jgi:hypothetical protein